MTIRVWRVTKARFAPGLDGEGARLEGGRWNSPGRPVVYCSATLSLAVLETLVHLPPAMRRPGVLPDMVKVGLDLPDDVEVLSWQGEADPANFPPLAETRAFGDRWQTEGGTVALYVPSAVIPEEDNIMLNPGHPDFSRIVIGVQCRFDFDHRLAV